MYGKLHFPKASAHLMDMSANLKLATQRAKNFTSALYAKTAAWAKAAAMKTGGFFTSIAGGLKTASMATWGFVKALIAQAAAWAMTPIGMITIAITAIVAGAILIWKNWSKVTAWFKSAWAWFADLWAKMPGWLQWCFPIIKITTIIVKNWSSVTAWFKSAWAWFSGLWSGMSKWARYLNPIIIIAAVVVRSWNAVKSFFSNFGKPIVGAFMGVLNFFTNIRQKLLTIGINIIKNIVAGMLSKITAPVDAIKGMVGKVRKLLPFSPAKEGPLKDLHQLKFSETIAQAIKPAPLVTKFTTVFGKIKENMPNTLSKAAQFTAGAMAPLAATAKLAAAPLTALAPQASQPIQITINIDARGAAPGVEQNIKKEVLALIPQIERALEQSAARKARIKH